MIGYAAKDCLFLSFRSCGSYFAYTYFGVYVPHVYAILRLRSLETKLYGGQGKSCMRISRFGPTSIVALNPNVDLYQGGSDAFLMERYIDGRVWQTY